jgi:hypothetical protein
VKPDLAQLATEWQTRLRLLDWRLQLEYVTDLATPDGRAAYGLCVPFVDAKRAKIYLRDPETSKPTASTGPSVEETFVHELLHLHFAPLSGNSSAEIAAEEQAVWSIAEAIMSAKSQSRAQIVDVLIASVAGRAAADALTSASAAVRAAVIELGNPRALLAKDSAPRRRAMAGGPMDPEIIKGALDAIEQGDSAKAIEILKGLIASAASGGASAASPPPPSDDGAAAAAAAPPGDAPGDDKKPVDDKAAKAPMAAAADPLMTLAARVQALEAERAARVESDERTKLFASRPDLAKEVRACLEDAPIETVRKFIEKLPRGARASVVQDPTDPKRPPTRGEGQGDGSGGRLPPAERAALDEAMGLRKREGSIKREGRAAFFGAMTQDEAKRFLSTRAAGNGGDK